MEPRGDRPGRSRRLAGALRSMPPLSIRSHASRSSARAAAHPLQRWFALWTATALAFALLGLLAAPARAQSLIRDAEIEDTLRVWTDPILVAAGIVPEDVDIAIINDPSINAFVARGQRIFLHTGLLMAAETPNEVIGVIAHETGHIAGGHLARSRIAAREAAVPAYIALGVGILAIAAGAPEAGVALLSGAPQFAQGQFVGYTQVQESSADQAAVSNLDATGQSGEGLISFFNREFRPYEFAIRRLPPYVMTHPYSSDRVESLRRRVGESPSNGATDSAENVLRFQMMQAKLIGFLRTPTETFTRYPSSDQSLPARYARAIATYRQPDTESALRQIQALIDEQPENPFFQELMGQVLFEAGRHEESIPFHQRSVELLPGNALLQINLARSLLAERTPENARAAVPLLMSATESEPDNGLAWRELAVAYDTLGEEGLARLASAEQAYAAGNLPLARNFAERARRQLDPTSVAYRKATDIINSAETGLQRIRDQQ
jgi:predicted Zn-dependent protease